VEVEDGGTVVRLSVSIHQVKELGKAKNTNSIHNPEDHLLARVILKMIFLFEGPFLATNRRQHQRYRHLLHFHSSQLAGQTPPRLSRFPTHNTHF
jgi:hypothetical protein